MISLDGTNFSSKDDAVQIGSARAIWSYFLRKVVRQGGLFAGHSKTEKFEELVDNAVRLSPCGTPPRSRKWKVPGGVSPSEYGRFLKKVFVRAIPTPILDLGRLKF